MQNKNIKGMYKEVFQSKIFDIYMKIIY